MKRIMKLLIVLLPLALSGCHTATISDQQVLRGKNNFESGLYRDAFQQLLPPASEGNAEAQYAVGYMYYYGYGVPQDMETGLFWIHKSADQKYGPAMQALQTMSKH